MPFSSAALFLAASDPRREVSPQGASSPRPSGVQNSSNFIRKLPRSSYSAFLASHAPIDSPSSRTVNSHRVDFPVVPKVSHASHAVPIASHVGSSSNISSFSFSSSSYSSFLRSHKAPSLVAVDTAIHKPLKVPSHDTPLTRLSPSSLSHWPPPTSRCHTRYHHPAWPLLAHIHHLRAPLPLQNEASQTRQGARDHPERFQAPRGGCRPSVCMAHTFRRCV